MKNIAFVTCGTRFALSNPRDYPLAPGCIAYQQRYAPDYAVTLPRNYDRHGQVGFIQYTLSGYGIISDARGEQRVERNACLLTAYEDSMSYRAGPDGWEFVYMTFIGKTAHTLINELCTLHGHCLRLDPRHSSIKALGAFTGEESFLSQHIDPALAARLAGNVLVHLTAFNAPQINADERMVREATALLSEDLSNPPSITSVAQQLGISREYLTRLFSEQMNCSPGVWLREQRLQHADLLLRSTDQPIADIAIAVGFQSASAFIAAFRQSFAETPKQWRKRYGGVD